MNKITKIVLITCLFLGVSWSRILWVNEQYRYIQDAIDNSSDGDTVSVLNGTPNSPTTWYENINFKGGNIMVTNRDFLGGNNNPATCIIDGGKHSSVVTLNSGENRNAVLQGFTIQNGDSIDFGGGIQIDSASPTITNNIIRYNHADYGGGIASGRWSGLIMCPLIKNNYITRNRAEYKGGGIDVNCDTIKITNNIIVHDTCYEGHGGGGIHIDNCKKGTVISGNVIDTNYSGGCFAGGGILFEGGTDIKVRGNIIRANSSDDTIGCGIYCIDSLPDLGIIDDPGFNIIMGNNARDIYNAESNQTLRAIGNYWGTLDTDTIKRHVGLQSGGQPVDFSSIAASDRVASVSYNSACSTDVIITGDLTVNSGVTLNIASGKTFKFTTTADTNTGDYSVYELLVKGKLYAIGTSVNEVKFTSNATSPQSGNWYGIRLKSNSVGRFNNCQVKYGYCGIEAINNDTLYVDSSLIQSNQAYGINIIGAQSAEIKESEFNDDIRGIYCTNNTAPIIVNNKFQNLSYGISLAEINDATISNNYINGIAQATQMLYGITVNAVEPGVHIDSNTIKGASQAGIYCHGETHANIYQDTLLSNSYYGILCYYSASPTIRWCTIANHDEGVHCEYASHPDLGISKEEPGNNIIDTTNDMYVVNHNDEQEDSITAIFNWWGTDELDPDKFAGSVKYNPWRTDPPEGGQSAGIMNITCPFILYAPKPNPTSRAVKIAYSIPNKCRAELIIYNTAGGVIAKTVEDKDAGYYEYIWNNHKFPNGVYIIRLKADNMLATQKVVIAK